jgi:Ca2+-binding EF-hand superfamily protein
MSDDGKTVDKEDFIKTFKKKMKYRGDLNYIYSLIDTDDKGYFYWNEMIDFYLPFVRNVTI